MKKLLVLVMALAFFTGSAFAATGKSELNVKIGLDPVANIKYSGEGESYNESGDFGFNVSAEYLYGINDILKVGGGLEYLFKRKVKFPEENAKPKVTYLPIYATLAVNPIKQAPEVYFKGNIGYNVSFDMSYNGRSMDETDGGLYWALGAGYEFDFGLLLEAMYGFYYTSMEMEGDSADLTYSKLGINIGYKFKL